MCHDIMIMMKDDDDDDEDDDDNNDDDERPNDVRTRFFFILPFPFILSFRCRCQTECFMGA